MNNTIYFKVVFWRWNIREMLAAKYYEWNIFAKMKASLPLENYRETNVLARTWILFALVQIINFELIQMPNSAYRFVRNIFSVWSSLTFMF